MGLRSIIWVPAFAGMTVAGAVLPSLSAHPYKPLSRGGGAAGIREICAHLSTGQLNSPGPSLCCGRGMTGWM